MPPAARVTDSVSHPAPPVLSPGPGSPTVLIGFLPAWRAVPAAAAAAIEAAKKASDATIKGLENASNAAQGPAKPVAMAAEAAGKAAAAASLGSMMSAAVGPMGPPDIHACLTPSSPVPVPHGPGVVLQASKTVLVNGLPLARQGDKVIEPLGPPNAIAMGCTTVNVG